VQLESAAADVLLSLRNALEDGVEPERPAVQVFISSTETSRSIRSLTSDDVSRLVCIPGIIIASSRCKARLLPHTRPPGAH
jgi:DNA replicative helicase MCM subunit Mcm2 (Cdc46/Mcm family)